MFDFISTNDAIILLFIFSMMLSFTLAFNRFITFINIVSEVAVYHNLSIQDQVMFQALTAQGVVPSGKQIANARSSCRLFSVVTFCLFVCFVTYLGYGR